MAGTVALIALDEHFVASDCVPMLRAAAELSLSAIVIGPIGAQRELLEAEGARGVPLEAGPRRFNPIRAGYAAGRIAAELKAVRPDLVHCLALRSALVGGAAAATAGADRRIYALPGLGYRATKPGLIGAGTRACLRLFLTERLRSPGTRFLLDNEDDARLLGLDPGDRASVELGSSPGIDAEVLRPSPPPPSPPLRVATIARSSWLEGTKLLVEAVGLARSQGAEIELSVYADRARRWANRKVLRALTNEPGIAWREAAEDVAAIWGEHHVACFPARGGEGLPRMLAEAASCGRPIVASDLPGPRRLVRDGLEGFLVPPDDPPALATALLSFARDPVLVPRMGAAARARVLHGFTEREVTDGLKRLYADMLGGAARS